MSCASDLDELEGIADLLIHYTKEERQLSARRRLIWNRRIKAGDVTAVELAKASRCSKALISQQLDPELRRKLLPRKVK
jgi:hypothetical protein